MNLQTNPSGAVTNRAYRNLRMQTAPTATLSQVLPIRFRLPRTNQLCLHYQRLRRIRRELHRKEDNRPIQLQLMPQLLIWLL